MKMIAAWDEMITEGMVSTGEEITAPAAMTDIDSTATEEDEDIAIAMLEATKLELELELATVESPTSTSKAHLHNRGTGSQRRAQIPSHLNVRPTHLIRANIRNITTNNNVRGISCCAYFVSGAVDELEGCPAYMPMQPRGTVW